jgi:hypothetical protein
MRSYLDAFFQLESERSLVPGGMAAPIIGPIPWSKIERWIEVHSPADPDLFRAVLEKLDDIYLAFHRSKSKKGRVEVPQAARSGKKVVPPSMRHAQNE